MLNMGFFGQELSTESLKAWSSIVLKAWSQSLLFSLLCISSFIFSHFFPPHLLNLRTQESTDGPLHCLSSLLYLPTMEDTGLCPTLTFPFPGQLIEDTVMDRCARGQLQDGV